MRMVVFADLTMRVFGFSGKFDMDVSGHYSRSDVFGLMVDEREQTLRVGK